MFWSLIESGHGLIRYIDWNTDINNLTDSLLFISKLSEKCIELNNNLIPSFMLRSKVGYGLGEVSLSLFSESLSVSDVLDALFKCGGVVNDSLPGVINRLLAHTHECLICTQLILLLLLTELNPLNQFYSDIIEFSDKLLQHLWVGEIH